MIYIHVHIVLFVAFKKLKQKHCWKLQMLAGAFCKMAWEETRKGTSEIQ